MQIGVHRHRRFHVHPWKRAKKRRTKASEYFVTYSEQAIAPTSACSKGASPNYFFRHCDIKLEPPPPPSQNVTPLISSKITCPSDHRCFSLATTLVSAVIPLDELLILRSLDDRKLYLLSPEARCQTSTSLAWCGGSGDETSAKQCCLYIPTFC